MVFMDNLFPRRARKQRTSMAAACWFPHPALPAEPARKQTNVSHADQPEAVYAAPRQSAWSSEIDMRPFSPVAGSATLDGHRDEPARDVIEWTTVRDTPHVEHAEDFPSVATIELPFHKLLTSVSLDLRSTLPEQTRRRTSVGEPPTSLARAVGLPSPDWNGARSQHVAT
ncbi:hypothetical protein ACWEPH_18100 [Nocardia beijingensis]